MQKRNSNPRIQIASREKRPSGKSLNINHNKKIVKKLEKELLEKIDNILVECKLNNDLIPTFAPKPQANTNNDNNLSLKPKIQEEQKIEKQPIQQQQRLPSADPKLKQIKMPKATKNLDFDQNMPNINISLNDLKKEKKLPKVKKKKQLKNHKDGFLTGVGIIKTRKSDIKPEKKEIRQNRFLEENDRQINEMLKNIDDIDNFIKNPEKTNDSHLFEGSPGYRDRMAKSRHDFEELIKEIDGYKKEMEDEFDIIKYLINFTNNTEKLIDRHKNVINGIFKGAGLKKQIIDDKNDKEKGEKGRKIKSVQKSRIQNYLDIIKEVDKMDNNIKDINEDEFENYDDEFLTTSVSELNGVFYKLKKINQIKDNLSNIQDDCLGYHEKLKDTLKRSQSARPQLRKDLEEKEEQKV